jgi:hypothetical protein
MTPEDFLSWRQGFEEECAGTMATKGREYAGNNDRFANFRGVADRIGITPLQAWGVFALKHVDAIFSFVREGQTFSTESIRSRYMDLRNYVDLGLGMIEEDAALQHQPKDGQIMECVDPHGSIYRDTTGKLWHWRESAERYEPVAF